MEYDPWSISIISAKFLIYAFSLFSVGTFLFTALLKSEQNLAQTNVSIVTTVCAIASSFSLIPLSVGLLNDTGIFGMFDMQIFNIVVDSPIGESTFIRMSGLALLLVSYWLKTTAKIWIAAIGAMITCWSFAQLGHLNNIDPVYLKIFLILHLLGASFWIGAFAPLYKAAGGAVSDARTAELADQFGRIALIIVATLFFAGLLMVFILLGSPHQLYSSNYGQTLLLKILIFFTLLGFAALNKLRIVPSMRDMKPNASRNLQKVITIEVALVCAILMLTAILTTSLTLPSHH